MIYIKCTRNGNPSYSFHEGMDSDTVNRLLIDLGCTDVVEISEEDYNSATRAI